MPFSVPNNKKLFYNHGRIEKSLDEKVWEKRSPPSVTKMQDSCVFSSALTISIGSSAKLVI